ncbi:MAG: hypothetical protein OHK0050_33920 [Roseiflexaceae bacterium]
MWSLPLPRQSGIRPLQHAAPPSFRALPLRHSERSEESLLTYERFLGRCRSLGMTCVVAAAPSE